jgi:RNA polymerase sigma factor (sigma-70 family)
MPERVTEAQLMDTYWETIGPLYRYASRRCGGQRELAEDVTQETWFRAVRQWRVQGIPPAPLAWLTTVARNLIVDQLRKARDVPLDRISPTDVLLAVDRDDVSGSIEIVSVVTRALARLPGAESQLLEAFHFERFKVAQLAELYGISERAVEGRLRRARERLRQELETILKGDRGFV